MICLCKQALAAHPVMKLDASMRLGLPLPSLLVQLAAAPGFPNMGLLATADLAALAALKLPPFPLSMALRANLQATLHAAAQLGLLGIGPALPPLQVSAQLSGLMLSFKANLPGIALPIPSAELVMLARVAGVVNALKVSLGIDLFAPGAMLQLQAALTAAAALEARLDAGLVANLSAYASLAASLSAIGGIGNLLPTIRFMLALKLPGLSLDLGTASNLLALLNIMVSIKAAFGVDLGAPGAVLALRARLALLAGLPLKLSAMANLKLALQLQAALPHLSLLAQLAASLKADMHALIGLPFPNFGPITLAATLGSQMRIALKPPCLGGCPLA